MKPKAFLLLKARIRPTAESVNNAILMEIGIPMIVK